MPGRREERDSFRQARADAYLKEQDEISRRAFNASIKAWLFHYGDLLVKAVGGSVIFWAAHEYIN